MTGNSFGKAFSITTFGESHGRGIGVVVDGVPPGYEIQPSDIQKELDRRKPGQSNIVTQRLESDTVQILSGCFENKTTGAPIALMIFNKDADSSKYESIKDTYRPGHADYTYDKKYGIRDHRGGGRSSGRETAARVAAGGIAKKILAVHGICVRAYTIQIGDVVATERDLNCVELNAVRAPDRVAAQKMETLIRCLKKSGDSVGGIIECLAKGVPPGLGDPVFDKLDADLAKGIMSIGAMKGIEIGAGFDVVRHLGSTNNDPITEKGFASNNAGGILGGISNGDDIIIRVAVKPPASIAKTQTTINRKGEETALSVQGRHDPTIAPRAVPVIESMVAIVLLDHWIRQKGVVASRNS